MHERAVLGAVGGPAVTAYLQVDACIGDGRCGCRSS